MSLLNKQQLLQQIHKAQYSCAQKIPGPLGPRYLTYADYIASGQPLQFIEEYIQKHILPTYANTHTESSFTGLQTQHFREEARQIIKDSVNASDNDALIFCGSGSTAAIDRLYRKLNNDAQNSELCPVVFLGPYEHHSNILPWREGNFTVVDIPYDRNGQLCLKTLTQQLEIYKDQPRLKIGSFSAASNVTGIIANVDEITALLHRFNALSFWDYAAGAPYMEIDMNPGGPYDKDAIFISTHKFVGGPGTPGLLIAKKNLFSNSIPIVPGGGTVEYVTKSNQYYHMDLETREEGGTPDILASIRAGLVFKLKDEVGTDLIAKNEHDYISRAIEQLKPDDNIQILGHLQPKRLGFLAFRIRCQGSFLHHNYVVALLNDLFGIQSRGGCSCAGPYGHDLLEIDDETTRGYYSEISEGNNAMRPGWVRLNFNYFIPEEEFQFLVDAIQWVADHGWKLLKDYHFNDETALWKHLKQDEKVPIASLANFLTSDIQPCSETGSFEERMLAWKAYFEEASLVANKALANWANTPLQQYNYDQTNHPLRWFILADDIQLQAATL